MARRTKTTNGEARHEEWPDTGFAEKLRHWRLARGWSQSYLTWLVDCGHNTISRLENGQNGGPPLALARMLAQALGVTVNDLMNHEDVPMPDRTGQIPPGITGTRRGRSPKTVEPG